MKTRITQLVAALFFVFVLAGNVNATKHDVKASSHENTEMSLQFENWMMDENIWSTSNFVSAAVETNLEMEVWMTNEFVWGVESQELIVEDWMTDRTIWEVEQTTAIETEKETELAMEQWMVKHNIWKI